MTGIREFHQCHKLKYLRVTTVWCLSKMFGFKLAMVALALPYVLGYDEKYDQIDMDKIVNDETMFNAYITCLLDKGPCSLEHTQEFRKMIPEVVETACAHCSEKQRANVRRIVKELQEKKPEEFKQFREKYDPKGDYEEKFTAFMVRTD